MATGWYQVGPGEAPGYGRGLRTVDLSTGKTVEYSETKPVPIAPLLAMSKTWPEALEAMTGGAVRAPRPPQPPQNLPASYNINIGGGYGGSGGGPASFAPPEAEGLPPLPAPPPPPEMISEAPEVPHMDVLPSSRLPERSEVAEMPQAGMTFMSVEIDARSSPTAEEALIRAQVTGENIVRGIYLR